MKEKELRFALVCFGGVSLAIYMHGINKEILKLVRASRALHGITERAKRASASFDSLVDRNDPEYDTEAVYFDLLREVGRKIDLRVVVDIIAGASAGGINGTMLARAICHDLPTAPLRDLWLDNADVSRLLSPEARARGWSKWFLRPVLWAIGTRRSPLVRDAEVRTNLSMFVRSRWFKPPLDGMRMAALMYEAATAMGSPKSAEASLLPSGRGLDLFVTVTDYYGYLQPVPIHDPAIIEERVHRHLFHFKYRRRPNGEVESDFDLANAPALAFAARATSSVPGAFPPARIAEMDELLRSKGATWPRRADFIKENFANYLESGVDPTSVPFIDGSVLNNRPFREAIRAIPGRPAYREVDRRIVYIDPDPRPPGARAHDRMPGFFSTLKGALSDIPRTEPVTDELSWVAAFNERARRLKAIIERARPQVSRLVANVMTGAQDDISEAQIREWREHANVSAAEEGGFAYEGYVGLKLASARAFVAQLIMTTRGVKAGSPFARTIAEVIDAWAARAEASDRMAKSGSFRSGAAQDLLAAPRWVTMLLDFDLDYRRRRLHFMIEGQNRLYEMLDTERFKDIGAERVDRLKRRFYDCLDDLHQRESLAQFDEEIRALVTEIFSAPPSARRTQGHRPLRAVGRRSLRIAHRQPGGPAGDDHRSRCQHPRHRRAARRNLPRGLAARGERGSADQLSRLSVLGLADLSSDDLARGRRIQRAAGRSHQRPRCARAEDDRVRAEAQRHFRSSTRRRSSPVPTARTITCWAGCTRSTGSSTSSAIRQAGTC